MNADGLGVIDGVPVHVALAAVMRDVSSVGKDGWNEGQGFNFRGIDSLLNHIGPAFRAHGIVVLPEVVASEQGAHYLEVTGSKSYTKVTYWARLTVRYRFVGPMGDHLDVVMAGEAFDSYDKSTTKALSQAYKYALVQMLALPTDEPDPDGQNPPTDDEPKGRPRDSGRANGATKKAPPRQQAPRPKPAPKPAAADSTTQIAILMALNDPVDDTERAHVKNDFAREFGKPTELLEDQVGPAWEWIAARLSIEPHAFADGGKDPESGAEVCSMCGTMTRAPWHADSSSPDRGPDEARSGSEGPGRVVGPPESSEGHTEPVSGAPEMTPEWVAAAGKADLIAGLVVLGLPTEGTIGELRQRLLLATTAD